uniref:Zinc knuckle CX2CX4HX4C n=1 Tax=Cannabis sativa TaxID=3483 RepID=A0A803NGV8_CANSA
MVDEVTKERDRLNYPRVLLEIKMNQELPGLLEFDDEYGMLTRVGVKYEWKPISCSNCFGMGHGAAECRKSSKPKQEWVVKDDKRKNVDKNQVDDEGFQKVTKGKSVAKLEVPSRVVTGNTFSVLTENNPSQDELSKVQNMEISNDAKKNESNNKSNTREGGGPSLVNG